jgi:hypothetical protein
MENRGLFVHTLDGFLGVGFTCSRRRDSRLPEVSLLRGFDSLESRCGLTIGQALI